MTAKPVPEHISDERLLKIRRAVSLTKRILAGVARYIRAEDMHAKKSARDPLSTSRDAADQAAARLLDFDPRDFLVISAELSEALTELQHRRAAEAAVPDFDHPYAGPFTGPLSAGQPIRWQVKCSNIADEWFTDEGSADQWANSPGHYDAEIVVWTASPPPPASGVRVKRWLVEETLPGGSIMWQAFEHEHQAREWAASSSGPREVTPLVALSALGEHP